MKPLNLSSPHLIIMVGIPGSGKTFFADNFASTFSAPIVGLDKIATELYGNKSLEEDEHEIVSRTVNYVLSQLLKTGQTIVYEGDTDTRTSRLALAKLARDNKYEPLLVWVQTESVASKFRATKPRRGAKTISPEQFDNVLKRFTPPNVSERAVVISGKHTYASQLKIVLKRLVLSRSDNAALPGRSGEGRHIIVR